MPYLSCQITSCLSLFVLLLIYKYENEFKKSLSALYVNLTYRNCVMYHHIASHRWLLSAQCPWNVCVVVASFFLRLQQYGLHVSTVPSCHCVGVCVCVCVCSLHAHVYILIQHIHLHQIFLVQKWEGSRQFFTNKNSKKFRQLQIASKLSL